MTISLKFCMEVRCKMAKKYCRKLQPPEYRRTNVTDDRQTTDGFAVAKSTHVTVVVTYSRFGKNHTSVYTLRIKIARRKRGFA